MMAPMIEQTAMAATPPVAIPEDPPPESWLDVEEELEEEAERKSFTLFG